MTVRSKRFVLFAQMFVKSQLTVLFNTYNKPTLKIVLSLANISWSDSARAAHYDLFSILIFSVSFSAVLSQVFLPFSISSSITSPAYLDQRASVSSLFFSWIIIFLAIISNMAL